MTVSLKKLLGKAGAGLDESYSDTNNLYKLLEAVINTQNSLVTGFNTLKGEYDAETNAAHVDSAVDDIVAGADIE